MILTLIPIRGRDEGSISVNGDTLTRYGVEFDLSDVPEGGEAVPSHPAPGDDHIFIGPISRIDGVIHATILVHVDATADRNQPDAPWTVNVASGPVTIPAIRKPTEQEEDDPTTAHEVAAAFERDR